MPVKAHSMQPIKWLTPILLALLLGACAEKPAFDTTNVVTTITPTQAVSENRMLRGQRVLWGGVIINSTNLANTTRIEVLAYPLDEDQRPDLDKQPLGRFLINHQGYLETVDYAAGRKVSVTGTITGTETGKLGETEYLYPLIEAEKLHLWAKQGAGSNKPQVHFGFGFVFTN